MAFWKPGTAAPGSSLDRSSLGEANVLTSAFSTSTSSLPIHASRSNILNCIESHQVLLLVSPTGSGKSTQVPQYLLESGWAKEGIIGVSQPRRVAAVSLAQRVAEERGSRLGDEIGYEIRFESLRHQETKMVFCTDGWLVREVGRNPLLEGWNVIMVDEAHERGRDTDLLIGILKKILRHRPSFRVIISSATIDASSFLSYFNADMIEHPLATVLTIQGRMFPVEIAYLKQPIASYVQAAVDTVIDIHLKQPTGDILVFLTGREEIDQCCEGLIEYLPKLPPGFPLLLPLPLHASLSMEEQMCVFEPVERSQKKRKVVISTNVAEASVTIEGIVYVVDCGLVKHRIFNPHTSTDILTVVPCSLSSLTQRTGRAGRTRPGKCFRLFPESALTGLSISTIPEICRSDLSVPLLALKNLGIDNVLHFDWLSPPPAEMLIRALEFLFSIGAITREGRLSKPLGERMAEVPMEPMMAKVLLESYALGCSEEILTIAAMTQVQNVFMIGDGRDGALGEVERRKFTAEEGDHLTLLNVYNAFIRNRKSAKWCHSHRLNFKSLSRTISIRLQLSKFLQRYNVPLVSANGDHNKIRRCLVSGYFKNAARMLPDGTYCTVKGGTILHVHPSSVLFNRKPITEWVIYHEIVETTKIFIRDLTVIDHNWLAELAPHYYEFKDSSN